MIDEAVMDRIKKIRGMSYRVETEESYDTLQSVTIFIGNGKYRLDPPLYSRRGTVYVDMYRSETDTDRELIIYSYVDFSTQATYPDMCKALDVIIGCLSRPYGEILTSMVELFVYDREAIEMDPVYYVEYSANELDWLPTSHERLLTARVNREYARSLI